MPTAARNPDPEDEVASTTSFAACWKPTGASSSTYEDRGRSSRSSVRSRRIEESGGSSVAVDCRVVRVAVADAHPQPPETPPTQSGHRLKENSAFGSHQPPTFRAAF